jgi:hypothetical protein
MGSDIMKHTYRILSLIAASALVLGWVTRHSEPSSHIGLRDILQAEQIDRGEWHDGFSRGIDHPLQPLLIVGTHHMLGGDGPGSWQRSALLLCFVCGVLLVVPTYLFALEVCGADTAWLASLVIAANPIIAYSVLNVLSESTFLLWWMFGLWAAVRFLREGQFLWLPLAVGFGTLAYLTRPEGMLLPLALAASLLALPVLRATRINWPRWWRALAFLAGGLLIFVGPYMALKGGLATKPPIAQVLGLAPRAVPLALEREDPLRPGQSAIKTYQVATIRVLEAFGDAVTWPLVPFAFVGMVLIARNSTRVRAALFLVIVLLASSFALVRLHATAGYCSPRHAIAPALLFILTATYAIVHLVQRLSIPGRWLGLAHERLRPGPAIWAALVALLVIIPSTRHLGPATLGPYSVYHHTGEWLAQNTRDGEKVLDLTEWSLYFSGRSGYGFADIDRAPADPRTRWIVVREGQIDGPWPYCGLIRELIGGREPVAQLPQGAAPQQTKIEIYARQLPEMQTANAVIPIERQTRRQ